MKWKKVIVYLLFAIFEALFFYLIMNDVFLAIIISLTLTGWMGILSKQWSLSWNAVRGGYSGIMTDPLDQSTPYSSGNRLFNITEDTKLISEVSVPTNPAGDFQKQEAVRTANGDMSTMKISFGRGNNLIVTDSVVYLRDNGYPPRLYDFYHLWSSGLDWLPTGSFLSVGFTQPPSMFNDLFQFEQTSSTNSPTTEGITHPPPTGLITATPFKQSTIPTRTRLPLQ